MIINHVTALSLAFMLYTILAIAFYGWGKITASLLVLEKQKKRSISHLIWIGWAIALSIFQLIHLVLPLTAFVVIPVLIGGIVLASPQMITAFRNTIKQPSKQDVLIISGIVVVLFTVTLYVASRSMLLPTNYDSGLYHLNKIRWISSFPIVPGLGNLHGRLAFNQSFFAYAAALNFYPFFGHGRSIANSFLLLLTIATFIELLWPALKQPYLLMESHPFRYLSIIIALPYLGYLAIASNGLTSPTPDLASILLQLTMIVVLARGLVEWKNGETNQDFRAIFLTILAVTAVTIKLSNLAFAAVIIGFVFLYTWQRHATHIVIRLVALSTVIILVWSLQGIVLSGAPLYPLTIGYLPVDWAVPIENVVNEANWVKSWARHPKIHWRIVLGNWDWLEPWFKRLVTTRINYINVLFPLAMAGFFGILTLTMRRFKIGNKIQYLEWAILAPSIIGLIYWFLAAPSPKFANALFFISSMCAILLFLLSIQNTISKQLFLIIFCVVLLITNLNFAAYALIKGEDVKSISLSGWHTVKSAPLEEKITASGLLVYTPKSGDQSWDSPLPSTPYFNEHLSLRDPENMSAGFTVNFEEQ